MSPKRKRVRSLLCFSACKTSDEKEKKKSEKDQGPGEKAGGGRRKGHHFRVLSKIIRLISIRSHSRSSKHNVKSRKDYSRSLARKTPDTSETQTTSETTLNSLLFSSSALSSSCSSCSCSSSSPMSSNIALVAPEFEPKVKAKKTFMLPHVFKKMGYVRALSYFFEFVCYGVLRSLVFNFVYSHVVVFGATSENWRKDGAGF